MNHLIKIEEKGGKQVVSARDLYEFLGLNKTHWKRWYTKNIVNNGFAADGVDYEGFALMANGNQVKDFALSMDFAKKIAMTTNTDKGEEARDYFLEMERVAWGSKETQLTTASSDDLILMLAQRNVEVSKRMDTVEQDVKELKAQAKSDHGYYAVTGYASLQGFNVDSASAQKLGFAAGKICRANGYLIGKTPHVKYGNVNTYPEDVLETVFDKYISSLRAV